LVIARDLARFFVGLTVAIVIDGIMTDLRALRVALRIAVVAVRSARAVPIALSVAIVVSRRVEAASGPFIALVEGTGVVVITGCFFSRNAPLN
jgi:hypothetical protein